VINARIRHFKKESQKLNLEFLEAQAELDRAKQAVQQSRSNRGAQPIAARPVAVQPTAVPSPAAVPATASPSGRPIVLIQPFAEGVGYSLAMQGASLWFDNEERALAYAQEVFSHCEVRVLNRDGTIKQHYGALSSGT
jgi:hypothetical protein